jgi:hypothetical protein
MSGFAIPGGRDASRRAYPVCEIGSSGGAIIGWEREGITGLDEAHKGSFLHFEVHGLQCIELRRRSKVCVCHRQVCEGCETEHHSHPWVILLLSATAYRAKLGTISTKCHLSPNVFIFLGVHSSAITGNLPYMVVRRMADRKFRRFLAYLGLKIGMSPSPRPKMFSSRPSVTCHLNI